MTSEIPPLNKQMKLPEKQSTLQSQPIPHRFKYHIKHEFEMTDENIKRQFLKRNHFSKAIGAREANGRDMTDIRFKIFRKIFKSTKMVQKFNIICFAFGGVTKKGIMMIDESLKRQSLLHNLSFAFEENRSITNECLKNFSHIFKRPTSLKNLKFAVHFRDQITDKGLFYLANAFKQLRSLQNLSLSFTNCNQITEKGIQKISKSLKPFNSSLQNIHLNFEKCRQMTGNWVQSLSEIFKGPASLKSFYLNLNPYNGDLVSDEWFSHVAKALGTHTGLKELYLELKLFPNSSDVGVESLCQVLKTQTCLQNLTLLLESGNITDTGILHINNALKYLVSLQKLNLGLARCRITDEGAKTIGEIFNQLPLLKDLTLDLDWCYLTDKGFEYIGQSLAEISTLEAFGFSKIGYGDEANEEVQYLMEGIQNLPLKRLFLDLSSSEEGYGYIAKTLKKLTNLEEVRFNFALYSQFPDEVMNTIAKSLLQLPSLKKINLNYDEVPELTQEAVAQMYQDLLAIPSVRVTSNFK